MPTFSVDKDKRTKSEAKPDSTKTTLSVLTTQKAEANKKRDEALKQNDLEGALIFGRVADANQRAIRNLSTLDGDRRAGVDATVQALNKQREAAVTPETKEGGKVQLEVNGQDTLIVPKPELDMIQKLGTKSGNAYIVDSNSLAAFYINSSIAGTSPTRQLATEARAATIEGGSYSDTKSKITQSTNAAQADADSASTGAPLSPVLREQAVTKYVQSAQEALGVRHGSSVDVSSSPLLKSAPPLLSDDIKQSFDAFTKNSMRGQSASATLPKLVSLVENARFQDYAGKALSADDLKKLNYSTAGAVIAADPNTNTTDLAIANAIISTQTGVRAFGSDLDSAPWPGRSRETWLDIARWLTQPESQNDPWLKSKDRILLRKGREAFEDYYTELRSLQGLDLLMALKYPPSKDFASELAVQERELVKTLKTLASKEIRSSDKETMKEKTELRAHAQAILAEYKKARKLSEKRAVIRMMLGNAHIRDLWRRYEIGLYQSARRSAAYIVCGVAVEDLKVWLNPFTYLVRNTFAYMKDRKAMKAHESQRKVASVPKVEAPPKVDRNLSSRPLVIDDDTN
jgi:hypothetical protein